MLSKELHIFTRFCRTLIVGLVSCSIYGRSYWYTQLMYSIAARFLLKRGHQTFKLKPCRTPIKMCILQTEDKNPTGPQAHADTEKDTERNRDQGGWDCGMCQGCLPCMAHMLCRGAIQHGSRRLGVELSFSCF